MRYLLLLFFIFFNIVMASEVTGKELEKVSLQLHWKYQFEFAGFIAAKEKGFYKDVGLDVELKEYHTGMDVEKAVLSGKSEYGIYDSFAFLDYLRNKPIKLISSYFKRSSKVSAMTAFTSNETLKLDKKGIRYNVFNPSDENIYVVQLELITSEKETLYHPKRVQSFKEASIRGWKYALSHKKEIVDIIHDKYSKKLTKKELTKEAVEIEKLILPFVYEVGSIDRNFLNKQIFLFKKHYKTGFDKSIDDYIFNYNQIEFTKNELDYIKNHQEINLCVNYGLFPVDGYLDGKLIGAMSEIFELISNKTSINFIPIESKSEKELNYKLNTKECSLLSVIHAKTKLFKTIVSTEPFSSTNFVMLGTLDKPFVHNPKMLKNRLLFVEKNSFKEYLNDLYPYLKIEVEYDKNKIIQKLLNDDIYAFVTLDEQADYFIGKYGDEKLKINGFLAKDHLFEKSIGVQRDEPILFSIIEKSLSSITKNKIQTIENSWKISRYQKTTDYSLLFKVIGGMSIVVLMMLYYHKKLQNFNKELESLVNEKTRALREINEYLEDTVAQKIQELIKKDEILTIQSKQAVMGEMISMIAHQWRQPLNMITLHISNIQIKQMMGDRVDDKELNSTLDEISDTIIYLSDTIDDFKTYFHPDKEKTVILLDNLIEKSINFVFPRLKNKNITLEHIKSQDIEVEVYTNELIQVFLNILNNAIDAYEHVESLDKNITITTQRHDNDIYIYIEDKAGGVKKEHVKKLFEPYFSTKGKNGTGLGLYMSQMIIEKQFKGEIYLNTSDEGTTFIVKIPTSLYL